jgi:GTPase SAR1 family protein
VSEPDPDAVAAVNRFIPNVSSASLEEGTRILREAALAEFQQTVEELQGRQKKVQLDFAQGQANRSDEAQKAATKQLLELQVEQMEKLKQIAAKSKVQIETFQQLKAASGKSGRL